MPDQARRTSSLANSLENSFPPPVVFSSPRPTMHYRDLTDISLVAPAGILIL